MRMSVTSTEYVDVPFDDCPHSPTADVVWMQFPPLGTDPVADGWATASWWTAANITTASCLVGPNGGLNLAVGTYDIYVWVIDNPEQPVKKATEPLVIF